MEVEENTQKFNEIEDELCQIIENTWQAAPQELHPQHQEVEEMEEAAAVLPDPPPPHPKEPPQEVEEMEDTQEPPPFQPKPHLLHTRPNGQR